MFGLISCLRHYGQLSYACQRDYHWQLSGSSVHWVWRGHWWEFSPQELLQDITSSLYGTTELRYNFMLYVCHSFLILIMKMFLFGSGMILLASRKNISSPSSGFALKIKIDINYVDKFIETCVFYRPVFHALSTIRFFHSKCCIFWLQYTIMFYCILGPALSPLGR